LKQVDKLVLSDLHFKQLVENSPDMIYRLNEAGDFLYVNESVCRNTGYAREELLAMNYLDLVPAESRGMVQRFYADQLAARTSSTYHEFPIARRDSSIFHVGQTATLEEDRQGLLMSVIARDISEQVKNDRIQEGKNAQLLVLLENIQAGVLVEDENRKIILVNRGFCDLFSVNLIPEDLIGKDYSYAAYFIKKLYRDQSEFAAADAQLTGNRNIQIGYTVDLFDGRFYERDYIPIYIETGYVGNMWKYRDITEKIKIRNELLKSEKKYKSVIDTMQLGLLEVDKNDKILTANDSFCRILEYKSVDELVGKPAFETLLDEDQQRVMKEQMAMRTEGISNAYEIKVKKANGDYAWMLISGAPLYDHDNNIIGSVGVHLDITYQKRIAIELEEKKAMQNLMEWQEKAMEHLEEKVIERTSEVVKQKEIIEHKNKEITNSINYALRIQQALLPDKKELETVLPSCFIVYKPKDIVSGDFYYFCRTGEETCYLAAADSTGHGVPGGFMSMLGSEKLHDAVQKGGNPGEILSILNRSIKNSLRRTGGERSLGDGFDVALCLLDVKQRALRYAGAHRPVWIIRKDGKQIEEVKATKSAIGGWTDEYQVFNTHQVQFNEGDTFYLFTDGYADQFGHTGKRLMSKNFKQTLLSIKHLGLEAQKAYLEDFLSSWQGEEEQTDDILIIGVRF
jgi:PAS domain S-box-containing protein